MNIKNNIERQYADSLRKVLEEGKLKHNRTGTDTLAIKHQYFHIQNVSENFPMIKCKKVFPYVALKEILWFLNGRIDIDWMNNRKVTIWDEWAKVDRFGIKTIGKSYGHQFRNFNGKDQIAELLEQIKNNPESRRLIVNLWNASDLDEMNLPPCVFSYHFEIDLEEETKGRRRCANLDLHVTQRSADSFLGVPYDFMSAAWFMEIICFYMNLTQTEIEYHANDIHYTCHNYHIYVNHIDQVKQYLKNVHQEIAERHEVNGNNENGNLVDKQALVIITDALFDKNMTFDDLLTFWNFVKVEEYFEIFRKYPKTMECYGILKGQVAI